MPESKLCVCFLCVRPCVRLSVAEQIVYKCARNRSVSVHGARDTDYRTALYMYNQPLPVGRSAEPARSFEVALTGGKATEADVQLGISVQFGTDCIVRNSKLAGEWGAHERDENLDVFTAGNPLVSGTCCVP